MKKKIIEPPTGMSFDFAQTIDFRRVSYGFSMKKPDKSALLHYALCKISLG
ncbi:hypothetical protein ACI0FM_15410 [Paenochrobactrum sp. BZR 588]|uniref:hypothetical protein n=1 Tax=Paenochrobactrum TaxID=999488 RepID=UPI0035BC76D5